MRLIGRFIFHVLSNALAILAAAYFVTNFKFDGDFLQLLATALILTLINTFVRPLLKLFLGPFILLTFGLLIIVINAATLYILDLWSTPLTIVGYEALLFGTLIVSAVNILMNFAGRSLFRKN
jgi:putative membrane protein